MVRGYFHDVQRPNGGVMVTRNMNSGLTIPGDIVPGSTWNQYFAWDSTTADSGSHRGSFNSHYTAMGAEVVAVPFGTFDAMRNDATIDVETGPSQKRNSSFTTSIWPVNEIGPVKIETIADILGVKFTETIELVDCQSP